MTDPSLNHGVRPDDGSTVDPVEARPTPQRRALTAEMETSAFRSATEIHASLRAGGHSLGLATVYRGLQALVEAGSVDAVMSTSGETLYRGCSKTHHHHLMCRRCGYAVEVAGLAVERWASSVAQEHGYAEVSHTLELFGTCPTCRKEERAS